ncbi:hypothetical protein EG68_07719, partial [Paragonimus skrjabini miyazakii]
QKIAPPRSRALCSLSAFSVACVQTLRELTNNGIGLYFSISPNSSVAGIIFVVTSKTIGELHNWILHSVWWNSKQRIFTNYCEYIAFRFTTGHTAVGRKKIMHQPAQTYLYTYLYIYIKQRTLIVDVALEASLIIAGCKSRAFTVCCFIYLFSSSRRFFIN